LNLWPAVYETAALPAELRRPDPPMVRRLKSVVKASGLV